MSLTSVTSPFFVTGWDKDNCAVKSSREGGSGRCSPNVRGSDPSAAVSASHACKAVRTIAHRLPAGQVGKLAQDGKLCMAVPVWYGFVLRQDLVESRLASKFLRSKDDLDLRILLSLPSKCWGCMVVPLHR